MLNVHRNHKAYYGQGEGGEGEGMDVGEEGDIYLPLHSHHQNDSCIKVGSDDSHFNVLFILRDIITRQCRERRTEADSN